MSFFHCSETEEPNVTFPAASQEIFPPATAPAPVLSNRHLKPRMPLEPILIEPAPAVNAPAVLFLVPRKIVSLSNAHPAIRLYISFAPDLVILADIVKYSVLSQAIICIPKNPVLTVFPVAITCPNTR